MKLKYFNCEVITNSKIYIKDHKYEIYKVLKNHNSISYSKDKKCDVYVYWKSSCKCVTKKYYATYLVKKEKYLNCKNLPPKCTSNNKFFLFYYLLIIKYWLIILSYCIQILLSIQPDFQRQKCEIEEFI